MVVIEDDLPTCDEGIRDEQKNTGRGEGQSTSLNVDCSNMDGCLHSPYSERRRPIRVFYINLISITKQLIDHNVNVQRAAILGLH